MINAGLKQGDDLSPIFFNITLKKVVRKALNTPVCESNYKNPRQKKLTAHADGMVLLSETDSNLQGMAKAVADESKQMSLIKEDMECKKKTMYTILQRKNNRHHKLIAIGLKFEWIKNFKYPEV